MQDPMGDELRALRERAYGPDADIDTDPVAMERLRQLEAGSFHAPSLPVVDAPAAWSADTAEPGRISTPVEVVYSRDGRPVPAADATPADAPVDAVQADAAEAEDADADAADAEAETAEADARPRRPLLVRAIALVLALIVGAFAAYAVMQLRPGSVATLAAAPDAEWPEFLGQRQDGSQVYEEFLGLTVAIVPQPWGRENDVPCLFVLQAVGISSITTVGCGAGGFPPTAALEVTEAFPDELVAEYPEGTALQFVLADDRVVVYADEP